jgi:hypothetical protein
MPYPFFTIGHSTHPIGEFIALLAASEIGLVADVRTVPRSRTNPQFNRETLPLSLAESHIAYDHIAELGGLRPRAKNLARRHSARRRGSRYPRSQIEIRTDREKVGSADRLQ